MDSTQETETRGALQERSGVGKEKQFQGQALEGWRGKEGPLYLQILCKGTEATNATAEKREKSCDHWPSSCLQGALVIVDCGGTDTQTSHSCWFPSSGSHQLASIHEGCIHLQARLADGLGAEIPLSVDTATR